MSSTTLAAPASLGTRTTTSLPLALAALGVVYGDIGTSPLYALRESLHAAGGRADADIVLGLLSLIFWTLLLVISIKYLVFILQADNHGEGGVLALTALIAPRSGGSTRRRTLVLVGLFATALLYGDGMITPAISVLSATEGLALVTPAIEPWLLPITILILVALFAVQRRGTSQVGRIFGPIMVLWFAVLALTGSVQILRQPEVVRAVNPLLAVSFFMRHGSAAFHVLGSVFLVVTGGEALYADLGHFGRRPIRLAWFALVLPALLLNYFGQGALVLRDPTALENPFFRLVPQPALLPLVILATAATVIASQALISGAFSLTMQAIQLGYLPRATIEHTSAAHRGQIYVPFINWALAACCIALVLGFGSSTRMAGAYGVAVTATMSVTTILFLVFARDRLHLPRPALLLTGGLLLSLDLAFLAANLLKIPHGGWFPLVIGALLFLVFTTWRWGRAAVSEHLVASGIPPQIFVGDVLSEQPLRVPGTAVFMASSPDTTPPALLHNLMHNRVLHEQAVLLSIVTVEVPHVPVRERSRSYSLGAGIFQVVLEYGFMDEIDVPAALRHVRLGESRIDPGQTSYFLGRETILARRSGSSLRGVLFRVMARNARDAALYFGLPPNRVIELGAQLEL